MENGERGQEQNGKGDEEYIGNMFGRKHTLWALFIILLVIGIAVCRYLVIQPDRFFIDPEDPVNMLEWKEDAPGRGTL